MPAPTTTTSARSSPASGGWSPSSVVAIHSEGLRSWTDPMAPLLPVATRSLSTGRCGATTSRQRTGRRSDVRLEPGVQRTGGAQARDDPLLRLRRPQPATDWPRLRHHDPLVLEELDAGMVLRIALGRRLQHLVGADVVATLAQC